MNAVSEAVASWRYERGEYEKQIKQLLVQLALPYPTLPSPQYQSKLQALKEYLKQQDCSIDEQIYSQVFVHLITGKINMSLMELANMLVRDYGGSVKFWQNKAIDIGIYVNYHPDLSVWQPNRGYQKYIGLPPTETNNLRKKRSLAKSLITALMTICKAIDKLQDMSKELGKIDELYKKLKKAQQKYYGFVQQIEQNVKQPNISTKGKATAKSNLFMFLKPKQNKMNTLINYNFKSKKDEEIQNTKPYTLKQYQQLNQIFKDIAREYRTNSRESNYSDMSNTVFSCLYKPLQIFQKQYLIHDFMKNKKKQNIDSSPNTNIFNKKHKNYTFIWRKQYYFSYYGFPTEQIQQYTRPLQILPDIDYDIDSQMQYDQINAEDIESSGQMSSCSQLSSIQSFVVSDNYHSEQQQKPDDVVKNINNGMNRWQATRQSLHNYQMVCLFPQKLPLSIQDDILEATQLKQKINGKSRLQIKNILQNENIDIPKSRMDNLLKNQMQKIKSKKGTVYILPNFNQNSQKNTNNIKEEPQTADINQRFLSINEPKSNTEGTRRSQRLNRSGQITILQQLP